MKTKVQLESRLTDRWAQRFSKQKMTNAIRMTAAQRDAIYGNSSNAPKQTSNVSQAQAEAKQKVLEREKVHQDAVNSDILRSKAALRGQCL
jgi:hypothetical protein